MELQKVELSSFRLFCGDESGLRKSDVFEENEVQAEIEQEIPARLSARVSYSN